MYDNIFLKKIESLYKILNKRRIIFKFLNKKKGGESFFIEYIKGKGYF